jgi:hypothetical protein
MSWRSASTSTLRPASRTASLVIGPIETIRAPFGVPVDGLDEVPHRRGGGERDEVGVLSSLERLGIGDSATVS